MINGALLDARFFLRQQELIFGGVPQLWRITRHQYLRQFLSFHPRTYTDRKSLLSQFQWFKGGAVRQSLKDL